MLLEGKESGFLGMFGGVYRLRSLRKGLPEGAIMMEDNLPIIDYKKCIACGKCVEKCPTKVIKWIN